MAIDCILAMTAAEIRANSTLPPRIGWMSCHFSPCGTGISNPPTPLPPGSLLILDDFVPFQGHDPDRILSQLQEVLNSGDWLGLLLDFQRPEEEGTLAVAKALVEGLACPVAVSLPYGQTLDCPIFLPPVPLDVSIRDYLQPWRNREIWLDITSAGQAIHLTGEGAFSSPLPCRDHPECSHQDHNLHCHYAIQLREDSAEFSLVRTESDLSELLEEAQSLGVQQIVGLWQELCNPLPGL